MRDAFRFDGLEALAKALDGFEPVARADVSQAVVSLSLRILEGAVMGTPQWSGAAAASWRVGVGAPVFADRSSGYTGGIFSMQSRNQEAVNEALSLGPDSLWAYTLKMGNIYIMNGMDYAVGFPQRKAGPDKDGNTVALRIENLPQRSMYRLVQDVLQAPRTTDSLTTQLPLGI